MEALQVTVGVDSDFVALLKKRLEKQKPSFEKAETALQTRSEDAKELPDAAFSGKAAQRDHFHDELDRLSSDRGGLSVRLQRACCQCGAARANIGTVSGQ